MRRSFPQLGSLDAEAKLVLEAACRTQRIEPGTLLFEPGQECQQYLLVQSGGVRVHLLDPAGHEIVLYRLGPGDTCVLTTAALLGEMPYSAYAIAEAETIATAIPAQVFDDLIARSATFRRFVFSAHAGRLAALMQVISDVAFTRVRVRLTRWLLLHADATGQIGKTHELIAVEIGTAREVISRNLKSLQRLGYVTLGQGSVQITDAGALAKIADGDAA